MFFSKSNSLKAPTISPDAPSLPPRGEERKVKNYKKYKVQFTRYSYALSTYLRCTFFLVLIYVVSCKLYFVLNSMHVRMVTNWLLRVRKY